MPYHQSRRHHRDDRHLCASCQERKAKYQYRGHVRADRQHVLCFQCYRSAREQMRARQLAMLPFGGSEPLRPCLGAEAPSGNAALGAEARSGNAALGAEARSGKAALGAGAPSGNAALGAEARSAKGVPLSPSQIQHRRQMLAFLQSEAARCAR